MRPETTDRRDDAQGWAARLDALEPDVLPTKIEGQLQVWHARIEDLRSRARANDHPDLEAFEEDLDQVETVVDHAAVALDRLVDAPEAKRPEAEDQLARRMDAVEDELHEASQDLAAEVRTPSIEKGSRAG